MLRPTLVRLALSGMERKVVVVVMVMVMVMDTVVCTMEVMRIGLRLCVSAAKSTVVCGVMFRVTAWRVRRNVSRDSMACAA